jgi:hypothetical protein
MFFSHLFSCLFFFPLLVFEKVLPICLFYASTIIPLVLFSFFFGLLSLTMVVALVACYWVCFVFAFGDFFWGGGGGGLTVKDGGVLEINAHSRWSFEGIT